MCLALYSRFLESAEHNAFLSINSKKYEITKGTVYFEKLRPEPVDSYDEITESAMPGEALYPETAVIPNGGEKEIIKGGLRKSAISLDGTKAIALIDEDNKYVYSAGGNFTLFYIDDKVRVIDENVNSFSFSLSGDGVAYVKTVYENEDDYYGLPELWLYSNGKHIKIAAEIEYDDDTCYIGDYYCISPDGKTVGYTTEYNDEITGFVWNGKNVGLGKKKTPVFIADGAKFIYFAENDSLCVQKGFNNGTKRILSDAIYAVCFNKDLSEIVFEDDENVYISRNAGKQEQVTSGIYVDDTPSIIVPEGACHGYGEVDMDYLIASTNGEVCVNYYGVDSFDNTFWYTYDDEIVRLNNRREAETIAVEAEDAVMASDQKTLFYLKGDAIYKANGIGTNAAPIKLVSKNVYHILGLDDKDGVYFINDDGELRLQKGEDKPILISDEVEAYYKDEDYALFSGGKKLFYLSGGSLYVSEGKKGKLVPGIDGEGYTVSADFFSVRVTVLVPANDSSGDQSQDYWNAYYYFSSDGISFQLLGTDWNRYSRVNKINSNSAGNVSAGTPDNDGYSNNAVEGNADNTTTSDSLARKTITEAYDGIVAEYGFDSISTLGESNDLYDVADIIGDSSPELIIWGEYVHGSGEIYSQDIFGYDAATGTAFQYRGDTVMNLPFKAKGEYCGSSTWESLTSNQTFYEANGSQIKKSRVFSVIEDNPVTYRIDGNEVAKSVFIDELSKYTDDIQLSDDISGVELQLSDAELKTLNIFLSNFMETSLLEYSEYSADESLIEFAFLHNKINNYTLIGYEDIAGSRYGTYETLNGKYITETIKRFFDRDVTPFEFGNYRYIDGKFYSPAADGGFFGYLAQVERVEDFGDGTCGAYFTVFETEYDHQLESALYAPYSTWSEEMWTYAAPNDILGYAVIRPVTINGKQSYLLVELVSGRE